jgi:hypothetical protein
VWTVIRLLTANALRIAHTLVALVGVRDRRDADPFGVRCEQEVGPQLALEEHAAVGVPVRQEARHGCGRVQRCVLRGTPLARGALIRLYPLPVRLFSQEWT